MGKINGMIDIDSKKLRNLVETYCLEHGCTMGDMSHEIGRCSHYIAHQSCNRDKITPATVFALEKAFGIKLEDYYRKEPEVEPVPEPEPESKPSLENVMSVLNDDPEVQVIRKIVHEELISAMTDQKVLTEWTVVLTAAYRQAMMTARDEMARKNKTASYMNQNS